MAISIWAYPEKRIDGHWQRANPLVENPDYYPFFDEFPDEEPCPYPKLVPKEVEIGDSRIYAALLINERHAWSIDPIRPIVEERGFPRDACAEVADDYRSMGEDAKHASWVNLKEMEDFQWSESTITRSAMVSKEDSRKFDSNQIGLPKGVTRYSEVSSNGVRVSWTTTYLEAFGENHLNSILSELRSYGSPENVRLVLWCDR